MHPSPPPQGDSERARELRALISAKMDQLEREIQFEITKKVTEDFKDPLGPLNALTTAALASLGEISVMYHYIQLLHVGGPFEIYTVCVKAVLFYKRECFVVCRLVKVSFRCAKSVCEVCMP